MRPIGCWTAFVLLCSALVAGACTGEVGERRMDGVRDPMPVRDGGISSDGSRVVDTGPDPAICRGVTVGARLVLTEHCRTCHGLDGAGPATTRDILDVTSLLEDGMVIAGDAAASPIYQRMASGTMPPASEPRPSVDDIAYVAQWIACGAPNWAEP